VGSVILNSIIIHMLLPEDVTYARSVFGTYVIVIISSYVVLTNWFETQSCTIICELVCNTISAATPCM
jgi:hypothetical protein